MNKINNLTVDDIHNIRHENYEKTKELSFGELIRQTSQKAQVFKKRLLKYAQLQDDVFEACALAEPEAPYTKEKE